MKPILSLFFIAITPLLFAQENSHPLPRYLTPAESQILEAGYQSPHYTASRDFIPTPPPFNSRSIGEWEELQAIIVTWDAYFPVLRDIVKYSKEEVEVINICQDSTQIKNYLTSNGITLENLSFIEAPFNSVWVRDYGPNTVYKDDVDSLLLVDWIYNRPRPSDDILSEAIGDHLNLPVYATIQAPNDLVHTGGNFMSDGLGTGFSSQLILEENDASNSFGISNHSESDIESIMATFMGIQNYPKMESLLYDGINHIDMHMKLLDEQTLLVGEFPTNVSDGPQIEANIQFLLDNYTTHWGTDFKIERIIQPPCGNGDYPPNCQGGSFSAEYRTYTNALIVNKTILVPIYGTSMDDVALSRWRELKPGYKVYGIDCSQIINAGGAIHCVTKEVGVADPLWIAHREMDDVSASENTTDYRIEATIKHKSGIQSAQLFWTTDTLAGYQSIPMVLDNANEDIWLAHIPLQNEGERVFYYIQATAHSGKTNVRPLVAPAGYFDFNIENATTSIVELNNKNVSIHRIYPNPASAITAFEVQSNTTRAITLFVTDVLGRRVQTIFQGNTTKGTQTYFLDASRLSAGTYWVTLQSNGAMQSYRLLVY